MFDIQTMYIMPIMESFKLMETTYKFDQIWKHWMFNLIPDKPFQNKKWPECDTMDDEAFDKFVKAINKPEMTDSE